MVSSFPNDTFSEVEVAKHTVQMVVVVLNPIFQCEMVNSVEVEELHMSQ